MRTQRTQIVLTALATVVLMSLGQTSQAIVLGGDATVDSGSVFTTEGNGGGASFENAAFLDPFFDSPSGVRTGNEAILLSGGGSLNQFSRLLPADSGLTVQAGRFVVRAQIGNPNNSSFPTNFAFELYPGPTNSFNLGALDAHIISSSTPIPAPGTYETWTVVYDIPLTEPTIGQDLTFIVNARVGGPGGNLTFDGPALILDAIPEPSTGLLLGFGLFGLVMRRKTRSRV